MDSLEAAAFIKFAPETDLALIDGTTQAGFRLVKYLTSDPEPRNGHTAIKRIITTPFVEVSPNERVELYIVDMSDRLLVPAYPERRRGPRLAISTNWFPGTDTNIALAHVNGDLEKAAILDLNKDTAGTSIEAVYFEYILRLSVRKKGTVSWPNWPAKQIAFAGTTRR